MKLDWEYLWITKFESYPTTISWARYKLSRGNYDKQYYSEGNQWKNFEVEYLQDKIELMVEILPGVFYNSAVKYFYSKSELSGEWLAEFKLVLDIK